MSAQEDLRALRTSPEPFDSGLGIDKRILLQVEWRLRHVDETNRTGRGRRKIEFATLSTFTASRRSVFFAASEARRALIEFSVVPTAWAAVGRGGGSHQQLHGWWFVAEESRGSPTGGRGP